MDGILLGVAALACPVGMGLMMWFMARGMRGKRDDGAPASLDALREEHQRLGNEISRLEDADRPLSRSRS